MLKLDAKKVNETSQLLAGKADPRTGKVFVYDVKTHERSEVWPVDAAERVAMETDALEKPIGPPPALDKKRDEPAAKGKDEPAKEKKKPAARKRTKKPAVKTNPE